MDTNDLASDARDREINFILSDRDREKVQAIDDALARVEDGTYGVCESCEADIAEGRLEALPFTRLCMSGQAERENEAKTMKRFEEDRTYRRLVPGDGDEEGGGSQESSPEPQTGGPMKAFLRSQRTATPTPRVRRW